MCHETRLRIFLVSLARRLSPKPDLGLLALNEVRDKWRFGRTQSSISSDHWLLSSTGCQKHTKENQEQRVKKLKKMEEKLLVGTNY